MRAAWYQYLAEHGTISKRRILRECAEDVEFTVSDRYTALGIPRPDPATMCKGDCEGTGWVPVYMADGDSRGGAIAISDGETDPRLVALWRAAEAESPTDDGWHFVVCPDCNGTRLAPVAEALAEIQVAVGAAALRDVPIVLGTINDLIDEEPGDFDRAAMYKLVDTAKAAAKRRDLSGTAHALQALATLMDKAGMSDFEPRDMADRLLDAPTEPMSESEAGDALMELRGELMAANRAFVPAQRKMVEDVYRAINNDKYNFIGANGRKTWKVIDIARRASEQAKDAVRDLDEAANLCMHVAPTLTEAEEGSPYAIALAKLKDIAERLGGTLDDDRNSRWETFFIPTENAKQFARAANSVRGCVARVGISSGGPKYGFHTDRTVVTVTIQQPEYVSESMPTNSAEFSSLIDLGIAMKRLAKDRVQFTVVPTTNKYGYTWRIDVAPSDAAKLQRTMSEAVDGNIDTSVVENIPPLRMRLLNTDAERTAAVDARDDMHYDLWKTHNGGGIVRVTDNDTGNVVTIKQYPTYSAAQKEYNDTVRVAMVESINERRDLVALASARHAVAAALHGPDSLHALTAFDLIVAGKPLGALNVQDLGTLQRAIPMGAIAATSGPAREALRKLVDEIEAVFNAARRRWDRGGPGLA